MDHSQFIPRILFRVTIIVTFLFGTIVYGQNPVVCTPRGNSVNVIFSPEYLNPAQKAAYRAYVAEVYPNVTILDEATTTYNCHSYAWNISEGGSICWINKPSQHQYWNDGSYIRTNLSDRLATKVSYESDDHSAIVAIPATNYFISKWGSLGLIRHRYNDCPYNASKLHYYKLNIAISGNAIVALPKVGAIVTQTYTLSDLPSNTTVEWVPSDKFAILSGQGTSKVQVAIGSSGYIKAKIRYANGQTLNIPPLEVIASAAPIITDIEMFKYCQGEGSFTLKIITNNPDAFFTWRIDGGNANLYPIPYPDDASFVQHPNIFKAVDFYERGRCFITVTGANADNTADYTFSKSFDITEIINR